MRHEARILVYDKQVHGQNNAIGYELLLPICSTSNSLNSNKYRKNNIQRKTTIFRL